ncbi:conjugative transposon protein TraM [Dyadobacter sp. CY261]|uniref:conjugative transposon protein TraM n=1 Tax=Dyadobacter sp. CY261 TaxID=2907203 RepID=UPI001F47062C|nr:conjugative transposon protein TraM [Dyadobacter sp. CY261]MCF0075395.1 conjugative transposon protein TraM [Dyadobacter sp. CY261]
MTHQPYTEQFLRQRKFYLVLPLLALPFLTLMYWKVVVKTLDKHGSEDNRGPGLQLSLPSAALKGEQNMDKLAYYRKADQESASWAQQIKKDPYRQGENSVAVDSTNSALMGLSVPGPKANHRALFRANAAAQTLQEKQVHLRLRALDKALTSSSAPSFQDQFLGKDSTLEARPEITRFEKMMDQMQNENLAQAPDPEMSQLDGMLDKLLQLQQQEKSGSEPNETVAANKTPGLAVHAASDQPYMTLLSGQQDSSAYVAGASSQIGFYGLDEQIATRAQSALTAVIEHNQQLVSGNTVQLRLTRALSVAGAEIPANTFVYGIASLSGERLKIMISSLVSADQILPVDLSVYDLDGIEGIFIPGALSRTVAKQQLGSQLQGYELDAGGFSVGAQAASAGIQMGKMLVSRKTRLTQVTLREGYKVILRDTTSTKP